MFKLIALTTLATLAVLAPASAAGTVHFTGGTEQGLKVSFDYASKKVQKFKAKVRCTGNRVQTFTFPSIPVNSKGRFSVHQAGPSIDGRIKAQSAKGTLTLPGCDADANEVKVSAHSE
jgi:hypothetical protein